MYKEIAKLAQRSCTNCKYFLYNTAYNNITDQVNYGHCRLYTLLSRYSHEERYEYAQSNRFREDICGPEGKEFKPMEALVQIHK